jgi:hypothetical protein
LRRKQILREALPAPVTKSEARLTIGYNENIETLALIYNLSESGDYHFNEIVGPRGILAQALTAQFAAFRNHVAVTKLNRLLDDGFVDMYDIMLSLYHADLPDTSNLRSILPSTTKMKD